MVETVSEVKEVLSVDKAQRAKQMSFAHLLQVRALAAKEAEMAQSEEQHGGQVCKNKEGMKRMGERETQSRLGNMWKEPGTRQETRCVRKRWRYRARCRRCGAAARGIGG